ncbi:hypothetical protein [Limosilactobacillus sp.]|uniref:hypothetical protein n=1 Tax=Limosilactobacillus sp. TaxID=2773925 RepID=UPI003F043D6F
MVETPQSAFIGTPVQISSFLPFTQAILTSPPALPAPTPELKRKAAPIQNFKQLRSVLNSSARLLIMDLEFFQLNRQNQISQLAGRLYDQPASFNYYFYHDQQPNNRQLQFLRRYDLSPSQAGRFTAKHLLPRIVAVVDQLAPDYLVSWDNHLDFKALQTLADRQDLPDDQRFWKTTQLLDLEKLIAQQVWQGQKTLSLKKMCQLLNLPAIEFHKAHNDVRAIEWILKFYSHDLGREL